MEKIRIRPFRRFCACLFSLVLFFAVLPLAGCTEKSDVFGGNTTDPSADSGKSLYEDRDAVSFPSDASSNTVEDSSGEKDKAEKEKERMRQILEKMTLEEKVGQIFLIRCPEKEIPSVIKRLHPGGLLLFGRDFKNRTPDSLRKMLAECSAVSSLPLLTGVDEEGGTVVRASLYSAFRRKRFSSPRELFSEGGYALLRSDAAEKAAFLRSLSINLNLAPVCDLSDDPADFIYKRSFGGDPAMTAEFVKTVVEESEKGGVATVLKHFPGYGGNSDTHTGFAKDDRALEVFLSRDLLPFRAGIGAGSGAVLCAHTVASCLDGTNPVSLSPAWHEFLRRELSFDGVIMTDDLSMAAITDAYGAEEAAVLALLAGNDLLISSEYERQIPAVLDAVRTGRIDEKTLDAAVSRVLLFKLRLNLI